MVTAKLICVFVFAYAKNRFSHDAAHIVVIASSDVADLLMIFSLSDISPNIFIRSGTAKRKVDND